MKNTGLAYVERETTCLRGADFPVAAARQNNPGIGLWEIFSILS
jgi:hypothetical protein